MKRLSHRPWFLTVLACLLGGLALAQEKAAAPTPAPVRNPGDVAALVNGKPIPEVAVLRALRSVPPEKHAEARAEIINFLIDNELLDQYVATQPVQVAKPEVDTRVDDMKKQLEKQKLDYPKVLKDMMLSEEELRVHIAAEMRWEKFVDTQANEKALREMFEKSPEMFDGSMVQVRHILLAPPANDPKGAEKARQELLAIRKQIEDDAVKGLAKLPANADALAKEKERTRLIDDAFAAKAKEKSSCPSSKQGGDVGWFPRAGSMVEPFARTAFALKPYQMSDVVQTQFGLHLILLMGRQAGKPGLKFEEAKDDVKDVYASRLREALVGSLRQKAQIAVK